MLLQMMIRLISRIHQIHPFNFFNHLSSALEARGVQPSDNDPCLYTGSDVICVSFVDDCLFFSCSEGAINRLIKSISDDKAPDKLTLLVESDVTGFLGILLEKQDDGSIELKQTGLIERIL